MDEKQVLDALSSFLNIESIKLKVIDSGIINRTYLVTDKKTNEKYIFQRINHNVFPKIQDLMDNSLCISESIDQTKNKNYTNFNFIPKKADGYLYKDNDNFYWRLIEYIENKELSNSTVTKAISEEVGRILGLFHNLLIDIDIQKIHEVIKGFHRLDFRFEKFKNSIDRNDSRFINSKDIFNQIMSFKYLVNSFSELIENNILPLRIVHNDPKLSNILFDGTKKALCLIDLDTVMPGYINNDFGDAIRTLTNPAKEDEVNLEKVKFNFELFKSFTNSYINEVNHFISKEEKDNLAFFVLVITYEQLIRFYHDYLNYDKYYVTDFEEHNLVRTNVQLKLLKQMTDKYEEMNNFIKEL